MHYRLLASQLEQIEMAREHFPKMNLVVESLANTKRAYGAAGLNTVRFIALLGQVERP